MILILFYCRAATIRKRLYIAPIYKNIFPLWPSRKNRRERQITENREITSSQTQNNIFNQLAESSFDLDNFTSYNGQQTQIGSSYDFTLHNDSFNQTTISNPAQDNHQEPNTFRADLLQALRIKHNILESDTIYIDIKDLDSCLEYLLNWGLNATAEDIIKRPAIVIDNEK